IRSDLAREIEDEAKKLEMLRLAVDRFSDGLKKAVGGSAEFPPGTHTPLAGYLLTFAKTLGELFDLTDDPELIQEQLTALDKATEAYAKAKRIPRVAEVRWQRAKILSRVGQHRNASQEFRLSAQGY